MTEPLRIVIVEDEAILLMHLEGLVEDAGHSVVGTAMAADEAVEVIRRTSPELVLLDMHLKDGSSGLDVARALRDEGAVTMVFVTANARKLTDDMEGAAAVIPKPFSDALLTGSLAFMEECMHRPPPSGELPQGMRLASNYLARLDGIRSAM